MPLLPRVLIVDDESAMRRMLSEVLEMEGYPSEAVANGKEALDVLSRDGSARVILLDLMMPVVGGREFMEMLDAAPGERAKHIIVLVSAVANLAHHAGLGADGTLAKPFTFDDFFTVLEIAAYLLPSLSEQGQDKVAVPSVQQQVKR